MTDDSGDFAEAFGEAFDRFLREQNLTQAEASKRLGYGKEGKARLSSYCSKNKRAKPNAEALYQICVMLGFEFEYKGYKITAQSLNGGVPNKGENPPEQLHLAFSGQFDLTKAKEQQTASVTLHRGPHRIDLFISVEAAS